MRRSLPITICGSVEDSAVKAITLSSDIVFNNSSALLNIRSNEEALLSNLKTLSLEINEKLEALSAVNEALEEKLKLIEQKIKDKEVE